MASAVIQLISFAYTKYKICAEWLIPKQFNWSPSKSKWVTEECIHLAFYDTLGNTDGGGSMRWVTVAFNCKLSIYYYVLVVSTTDKIMYI